VRYGRGPTCVEASWRVAGEKQVPHRASARFGNDNRRALKAGADEASAPPRVRRATHYFSFVTVTSSWNWRFELGSSALPITMVFPSGSSVLPPIFI